MESGLEGQMSNPPPPHISVLTRPLSSKDLKTLDVQFCFPFDFIQVYFLFFYPNLFGNSRSIYLESLEKSL